MPSLRRHQVEVSNPRGLHIRAASRFVEAARPFQARIRVFCGDRAADGKSILDLMMLAGGYGARLDLEVTGPDAERAIEALAEVIEAWSDGDRQAEEQR